MLQLIDKKVQVFIEIVLRPTAFSPKSEISTQGVLSESDEGGRTGGESVVNPAKRESNLESFIR